MSGEGKYKDARAWMALAVGPMGVAASDIAQALARYDLDRAAVGVMHSYIGNAMQRLAEAQEHLMRAKVTLETIEK